MDSLTHIVLGAAIGEVTLGKKVGNKAAIIGAIAGSSPDFDVFFTSLFNPVQALFVHRGFSHSLLLLVIATPLLAWLFTRVIKNNDVKYFDWIKLFFFSILSHIFIDCFNTYGTGIFEPFSNSRIAYDSIGIIDLFLTIPMLIMAIWMVLYKKINKIRRSISVVSLSFAVLYIAFTVINKTVVEKVVYSQIAKQDIDYISIKTSPSPLSNYLWMVAIEQQDGFLTGYYSVFDKEKNVNLKYFPKNKEYLDAFNDNKIILDLIRFTKGYYILDKDQNGSLWMYDLRYGTLGIYDQNPWVFSFGITEKNGNVEVTRSHPDRKISSKTIREYWERVF